MPSSHWSDEVEMCSRHRDCPGPGMLVYKLLIDG